MRTPIVITATACIILLTTGCSRQDSSNDSAAREAGRAAYKLHVDAEKAAKKLKEDVQNAARDAHQGWNEAKQEHDPKR